MAPLEPGGTSAVRYDVVRSGTASNFTTSPLCISGDGLSTTASDAAPIAPGAKRFYLVRGENDCGLGTAGTTSAGAVRQVDDCP
jgi:hypothetical protein